MPLWLLLFTTLCAANAPPTLVLLSTQCSLPTRPSDLDTLIASRYHGPQATVSPWLAYQTAVGCPAGTAVCCTAERWNAHACRDQLARDIEAGRVAAVRLPTRHQSVTVNLHAYHGEQRFWIWSDQVGAVTGPIGDVPHSSFGDILLALGLLHQLSTAAVHQLYQRWLVAAPPEVQSRAGIEARLIINSEWKVHPLSGEKWLLVCVPGFGFALFRANTACLECGVQVESLELGLSPTGANLLAGHVSNAFCAEQLLCIYEERTPQAGLWDLLASGQVSSRVKTLLSSVMLDDAVNWHSVRDDSLLMQMSIVHSTNDGTSHAKLETADLSLRVGQDPETAAQQYCRQTNMPVDGPGCDKVLRRLAAVHDRYSTLPSPSPRGYSWHQLVRGKPKVLLHDETGNSPGSWTLNPNVPGGVTVVNDGALVERAFQHLRGRSRARIAAGLPGKSFMIDVGANTGSFSLLPALLENLSCISFEPTPEAFRLLQANVQANNISSRVLLRQFAVASKVHNTTIQVPVQNGVVGMGLATLAADPQRITELGHKFRKVPVVVTTLDTFLRALNAAEGIEIDLIKIDVEGFELMVLRGGYETLRRHRPVLFLEQNADNMAQSGVSQHALDHELTSLGYGCLEVSGEDIACYPRE